MSQIDLRKLPEALAAVNPTNQPQSPGTPIYPSVPIEPNIVRDRIVEHRTITHYALARGTEEINNLLSTGYQPFGPPVPERSVYVEEPWGGKQLVESYVQAMVRYA